MGYSPGGHKELDMTELLSMHTHTHTHTHTHICTHTHTHDICKTNVFFDGERLKAFPQDEKQGKYIFVSQRLFNIALEVLVKAVK